MRPAPRCLFHLLWLVPLALVACGDDDAIVDAGGGTDAGPARDGGGGFDGGAVDGGDSVDAGRGDAGPVEPVDPFDGIGDVELVATGGPDRSFSFLEGPHWRSADGVLLFTDIPEARIYRLTPPDAIDVFREGSNGANGLTSDRAGNLLAAEHEARRVSITRGDAAPEAFVETYMGDTFNSPNDLVVRSDGTVYFTDPPFGLGGRPREIAFNGVFRVAPGGEVTAEVMGDSRTTRPNGIALSPDETVLYLADSMQGDVRTFDVAPDGSLSNEAPFADAPNADGMAVDVTGNLYVTTAGGVMVVAPSGEPWGTIDVPMTPANCAFGDADRQTLYITARTGLYRVRMPVAGL